MPLYPVAILFSSLSVTDTRVRCLCIESNKIYYTDISPYTENPICFAEGTGARSRFTVNTTSKLEIFLNDIHLNQIIYQKITLPDGSQVIADAFDYEIVGAPAVTSDTHCTTLFSISYKEIFDYIWRRSKDSPVLELFTSLELSAAACNPAVKYGFKISSDNRNWQDSNIIFPDNVLWFRTPVHLIRKTGTPSTIQFPRQMMSVTAIAKNAIVAPEICCNCSLYSDTGASITLPKRMFILSGSHLWGAVSGELRVSAPLSSVLVDMSNYDSLSVFSIDIHSCIGNKANLVLSILEAGTLRCKELPSVINIFNGKMPFNLMRMLTISGSFAPNPVINLMGITTELLHLTLTCYCTTPVKINIGSDCKISKILYSASSRLELTFINQRGTRIARG